MLDLDLVRILRPISGPSMVNIKLTPIVLQDYLMLILTVPLIDQSLQMNLYHVYNLPLLHPKLNVHAQCEIEGTYLATLMEGMFISLPSATDIKLCIIAETLGFVRNFHLLDKGNLIFSANAFWLFLVEDFKLQVIQIIPIKDKYCLKYIR